MALDIFTNVVGGNTATSWPTDPEEQAMLAVRMLDAVQTIADVLMDEGMRYRVGFADLDTAYSDHTLRQIVISAKPMTEGGRPFDEIAAIMTGFAVHEIGHTKNRELAFSKAVHAEWPGKVTPHRLANILGDVRLEAAIVARFAGLRDVFVPTMVWVADKVSPKHEIAYGKTLHDRLNFVGQAVRYPDVTKFAADPETQSQLRWWQDWGAVDDGTDNDAMLQRVRDGLARVRDGAEHEPVAPPPPDNGGCQFPSGNPPQGNPDGDEEPPTEGGDQPGPGGGEPDDDGDDTEGGDGDGDDSDEEPTEGGKSGGDEDGDEDGPTEGGDSDGDPDDDDDGEGNPGGEPTDDEPTDGPGGQLAEGKTLDRIEGGDAPQGDGEGGSGQAVSNAPDADPDEGLDTDKLNKTQDDLTEGENDWAETHEKRQLQRAVNEERSSSRLDGGAYGKMRVKVQL
jgi:hypothetical protein